MFYCYSNQIRIWRINQFQFLGKNRRILSSCRWKEVTRLRSFWYSRYYEWGESPPSRVCENVLLIIDSIFQNTTLRILKRYTQFVTLHKTLSDNYPKLKQFIPPLPPKSSLGKLFSRWKEGKWDRRNWLTDWI